MCASHTRRTRDRISGDESTAANRKAHDSLLAPFDYVVDRRKCKAIVVEMPVPHTRAERSRGTTGIHGFHAFPAERSLRLGEILRLPGRQRSQHTRSLFARKGAPAMWAAGKSFHRTIRPTISAYCQYLLITQIRLPRQCATNRRRGVARRLPESLYLLSSKRIWVRHLAFFKKLIIN